MKRKYLFSLILIGLIIISMAGGQLANAGIGKGIGKIPWRNIEKPVKPRIIPPRPNPHNVIMCDSCEDCTQKINQAKPGNIVKLARDLSGSYIHEVPGKNCAGDAEPVINKYNACIFFNNSNVTLNCNGHSLLGEGNGYGIFIRGDTECVSTWERVLPSRENVIKNCKISNYVRGIHLWLTEDSKIEKNILESNSHTGIMLFGGAKRNIVEKNTFKSNEYGLFLDFSQENTIRDNNSYSNNVGIILLSAVNNNLFSNKVCYNQNSDIETYLKGYGYGNKGNRNICDKPINWNDYEKQGCTFKCSEDSNKSTDKKSNQKIKDLEISF